MKVIFTDNVKGVAVKGDLKSVKNGYYRNFLQPRAKAVPATESQLKAWEGLRKQILIQQEQFKSQLEEIKRRIGDGGALKIEKKVTSKGTLYGGVKALDIVHALKAQMNIEVHAEAVMLGAAMKAAGKYTVKLNLGVGVEASLPIEIVEKK